MFVLNVVLVACALFFKCDASFVDTLPKCSIKNDECIRELYQNNIAIIHKEGGVPELNIGPIDPMDIANTSVTVLDAIQIHINEGIVIGISKCQIKSFHIDLEKKSATQELLCNLTIEGQVSVNGSSPAVAALVGDSKMDGFGKGKVELENLYMKYTFSLYPFKKEDGNIYFKVSVKNIKYKYDVDKATFSADKIIIGKNDISQVIIPYLNSNFKMMLKTFGKPFIDKAMEFYFDFVKKYFEGIPTKNYIIEDLEPYVQE